MLRYVVLLLSFASLLFANIPHNDTYGNDLAGNLVTKTLQGTTHTYTYDANDRLIDLDGQAYTYDANGNLIDDGTDTYEYDDKNRLVKVTTPNGIIEYEYDAEDHRIAKIVEGDTTTYLIDTNTPYAQVITESKANGTQIHYTYGNDLLSDGRQYFLTDALGSTRALVDSTEQLTDTYDYKPYGELSHHEGVSDNSFLFTGEQYDSETTNYYLRARYYSPSLTLFLSRDTYDGKLIDPLSQNHYLYASGNPIIYVDPSGHENLLTLNMTMTTMNILASSGIKALAITSGIMFQLRANKQYYINVRYGVGHGYVHASSIHGNSGYQYDFVYKVDNALFAEMGLPVFGYIRKTSTVNFFDNSFVKLSNLQFKAWELAIFKIFPKAPDNERYSQRHMIYWKPMFNCYGYAYYAYLQGIVAMLTIPSI